jgi:hypothetical protein
LTYLLQWSFALPLALAVGWCDVVARLPLPPLTGHRRDAVRRLGWGLVVVAAAVSVLAGIRLALEPTHSDSPGVGRLTAAFGPVVSAELPTRDGPDLVLDFSQEEDWPMAAGLALWLREEAGREVLVPRRWVALFGSDQGTPGTEGPRAAPLPVLTMVPAGTPPPVGALKVAAGDTELGPIELWLTPTGS